MSDNGGCDVWGRKFHRVLPKTANPFMRLRYICVTVAACVIVTLFPPWRVYLISGLLHVYLALTHRSLQGLIANTRIAHCMATANRTHAGRINGAVKLTQGQIDFAMVMQL